MLNDRVLPFYEEHELPVLRILTDRRTEYCGRADQHDYQLYMALNGIEHTKTKVKSPQTNGIRERVRKTILNEFYTGGVAQETVRQSAEPTTRAQSMAAVLQ